jgi:hypothetical protein
MIYGVQEDILGALTTIRKEKENGVNWGQTPFFILDEGSNTKICEGILNDRKEKQSAALFPLLSLVNCYAKSL